MSVWSELRFWSALAQTGLCVFLFWLVIGLVTALPPSEVDEYVNSRRYRIGLVVAVVGAVGIVVASLLIFHRDALWGKP